jgi:multimeric flavodoxin WrbA
MKMPMKVLAINGSPRKGWNTATLLNRTLEGAATAGARQSSSISMTLILKDAKVVLPVN